MKDKKQRDESTIKIALEYSNNIIATLREPFLVLDKNLRVVSANRAFYVTFKVAEKDTIGRSLPDLGDKQWDIPKLLLLLREILPEKKVARDYEVEHKFEQIGERTMLLNACQMRIPKKIAAIIATGVEEEELILLAIEDITERKRAQIELKESEERYRRTFETSQDGLLLFHKTEGDILNSNKSVQGMLGYSHEEFLKKKLWEIGMVEDRKGFQEMMPILERDGIIQYKDIPAKTKNNSSIMSDVFLVDRAGVAQCNIRDITKRKKLEIELLRAKEENFKTIFDNALDGILLADPETKKFRMGNPAICRMLGYTQEEIGNLGVMDIHPEKDIPHVIEQFERQARGAFSIARDLPVKKKDGTVLYADVNASIVTITGKTYLMGFFHDNTERMKIEMELRKKVDELEHFRKATITREFRMEEMRQEMERLKAEKGK